MIAASVVQARTLRAAISQGFCITRRVGETTSDAASVVVAKRF